MNGVGLAFAPVAQRLRQEILQPLFLATHLLVQASQHLWLVGLSRRLAAVHVC